MCKLAYSHKVCYLPSAPIKGDCGVNPPPSPMELPDPPPIHFSTLGGGGGGGGGNRLIETGLMYSWEHHSILCVVIVDSHLFGGACNITESAALN